MEPSPLQRELRKTKPFDCAEEEALLNLVRSADVLCRDFRVLFAEHGISEPQYNVLRILRGHRDTGLPCQEIAPQMVTPMPDITRLVDRLEAAGLARRERIATDRRVVLVRIAPPGLELLARLDEPVRAIHKRQLKHLTRGELAELNRLLAKVRQPGAALS
jgi:DNA-binding MarR family transcriptional regulator